MGDVDYLLLFGDVRLWALKQSSVRSLRSFVSQPHTRHWKAPGSAMARARQEGSSPEPVEGLARDGPRPFPLPLRCLPRVDVVSCGLCDVRPPAAPAVPPPYAACAYPAAPPAATRRTAAWPRAWVGPRSRPRGPRPDGPQPSLSLAEQHLESPVPSAPGALAGGPTQAAPGVRGEEEQWAREIGAQLRRMADDLNAQYERRRQEEQPQHRPSPWRVLYNLIMGLLPFPRGHRAPEMEPN
nr:LOW QUALITY PROTEIN: bcl-2-binding component 3 [Aotus nancymaae]